MPSILNDLRCSVRSLRSKPGFATGVVITLAIGLGSAIALYSVVDAMILRPFPYPHSDQILVMQIRNPASPVKGDRSFFQIPEFLAYQSQVATFADVIAISPGPNTTIRAGGLDEPVSSGLVSGNTLAFLGIPVAYGRALTNADASPGAQPVFVMGNALWARLGAEPSIVGRQFLLDGVPSVLVGVTPPQFRLLGADIYRPISLEQRKRTESFYLEARLKQGATTQQAEAEFRVVAERLAALYPNLYPKAFTVKALTLTETAVGSFRFTVYSFAAAGGLLLLIACGNVTNMLLTRSTAGQHEMAIRGSLGGSPLQLVRLSLIESGVLGVLGAAGGSVLAYLAIEYLRVLVPSQYLNPEVVIRLKPSDFGYGLLAGLLVTLACGLLPALRVSGSRLLVTSGGRATSSRAQTSLRELVIVAEVALAVALAAGAGLIVRTFVNLRGIDIGADATNVLAGNVQLPPGRYASPNIKERLFGEILEKLEMTPGVVAAATSTITPLMGGIWTGIDVVGLPHESGWTTLFQLCSEHYFDVSRLKLLRGRVFSATEVLSASHVAVVNETFANSYFRGRDPIGQGFTLNRLRESPGALADASFEVVGVLRDTRNHGIQSATLPEVFLPSSITDSYPRILLVRTTVASLNFSDKLRRIVGQVDPDIVVTGTSAVTERIDRAFYAEPRLSLYVIGTFAVVSLALVGLGVFAVASYSVSLRSREVGIRLALGATTTQIESMLVRSTLVLLGIGICLGTFGAMMGTRVLVGQLWGVTPTDPATLGAGILGVFLVGLAAAYLPARRTTRINPIAVLRAD